MTSFAYAAVPRVPKYFDTPMDPALRRALEEGELYPHFQPIVDLLSGEVIGHEGLIRGPRGSHLESPVKLFEAARSIGRFIELELAAARHIVTRYAALRQGGKLFLNLSPETVVSARATLSRGVEYIQSLGMAPEHVIIELTEHQHNLKDDKFRDAVRLFRSQGFRVAIDDLGEGFSSLRLWSELQPELVKIDMHFVQNVANDRLKFEFLKALQQIAESCNTRLVAEGIECEDDLRVLRDLGVAFGQGYLIGRPIEQPLAVAPPELFGALRTRTIAVFPQGAAQSVPRVTTEKLLIRARHVEPATTNDEILTFFEASPDLHALPVVDRGLPIGLINRHNFIATFVRPYFRELYGKRSCTLFMDADPLRVDKDLSIQELSQTLIGAEQRHLSLGFIVTENSRYLGLGTGQDLIREITRMQIDAAKYANPLTQLPGNVPIDEHIERLLAAGVPFVACLCDLDNFKPFNDAYGYRQGDEMIKLTARVLAEATAPRLDFLGHIGGDDFVLLLQSTDWEARCRTAIAQFEAEARAMFKLEDLEAGGFRSEDRRGQQMLFPLTTLSIGAVPVGPHRLRSHLEVSTATAEAKRNAKRLRGSSLFIERRAADDVSMAREQMR